MYILAQHVWFLTTLRDSHHLMFQHVSPSGCVVRPQCLGACTATHALISYELGRISGLCYLGRVGDDCYLTVCHVCIVV
jgi:hypothetical protein